MFYLVGPVLCHDGHHGIWDPPSIDSAMRVRFPVVASFHSDTSHSSLEIKMLLAKHDSGANLVKAHIS